MGEGAPGGGGKAGDEGGGKGRGQRGVGQFRGEGCHACLRLGPHPLALPPKPPLPPSSCCTPGGDTHSTCGEQILSRMGLSLMFLLLPDTRSVSCWISARMALKSVKIFPGACRNSPHSAG